MSTRDARDPISHENLAQLRKFLHLMDKAFAIAGTNIRFGVGSVVGLIPVVGDTLAVAVSGYIYSFAKEAGVPWHKRIQMVWNIFINWLVGLVPFLAIFLKSHSKRTARKERRYHRGPYRKSADSRSPIPDTVLFERITVRLAGGSLAPPTGPTMLNEPSISRTAWASTFCAH